MKHNIGIMSCLFLTCALPASADQTTASKASLQDVVFNSPTGTAVTRQQAGRIAINAIRQKTGLTGRVTWSGREDDFGARWEIEVTVTGGQEYDVLVRANGTIAKIIKKRVS